MFSAAEVVPTKSVYISTGYDVQYETLTDITMVWHMLLKRLSK